MPVPLGKFISEKVYGGKLQSQHPLKSPRCCRFVDVAHGQEELQGHSWIVSHSFESIIMQLKDSLAQNTAEVQVVEQLAAKLNTLRMSYRIITPYDAQRGRLEQSLKQAELPWEDKCFNVDSFQGLSFRYLAWSRANESCYRQ
jgi:hypothetical protein